MILACDVSFRADKPSTPDWPDEETDLAAGGGGNHNDEANGHLWEESWDDDDTSEDFSQMLKYVDRASHSFSS